MFWLLVWACISIHLILRFDGNVNSACQGRWYIKILAQARQVRWSLEAFPLPTIAALFTQSTFFPFFILWFFFSFLGVWCVCITLKISFTENTSRKVTLLSTIQLTCIRVGHWCFKPDYSFHQMHTSIQAATSVRYLKPHYGNIFLATSFSQTEPGCKCGMEILHPTLHCSRLKLR